MSNYIHFKRPGKGPEGSQINPETWINRNVVAIKDKMFLAIVDIKDF